MNLKDDNLNLKDDNLNLKDDNLNLKDDNLNLKDDNNGVKNFIIDNKLYLISYSNEDKNYNIFFDYNNIYIRNYNIIKSFRYNDNKLELINQLDSNSIGNIKIIYESNLINNIQIISRNNITLQLSDSTIVKLYSNIIFEVPLKIIKYTNNSQNYNIQLFSMYFKNSVEMLVDTGGGSGICILRSQLTDDYINSTPSLINKWDEKTYDYFNKPVTIIDEFQLGMNINKLNLTNLDIVYTVVPVMILRDDYDKTLDIGDTGLGAQVFGGNNRNLESKTMNTLLNNPLKYINSEYTVVSGGSVLINENKENTNKNKEPQFQYVSFVPDPLKNEMCIRFLSDIDTQIQKKYISSIAKDNGATLACRINTNFSYYDNNNFYEYNNIGQYSSNLLINNILNKQNLSNLKNTGTGFAGGLDDNIPVVGLDSGGGNLSFVGTNSPNFNATNFMNNYKNLSDIFDKNSTNFFPFEAEKVSVSINNNKIKTKTNVNANIQLIDSYDSTNIYTFNINIDNNNLNNDNNNLNNGGMYGGIYIYKSSDDFRSNLNTVFFRYNSITYPLNYYNDKITPSKIYLSPIN